MKNKIFNLFIVSVVYYLFLGLIIPGVLLFFVYDLLPSPTADTYESTLIFRQWFVLLINIPIYWLSIKFGIKLLNKKFSFQKYSKIILISTIFTIVVSGIHLVFVNGIIGYFDDWFLWGKIVSGLSFVLFTFIYMKSVAKNTDI